MLTINILNDQTGTDESANYTYEASVNGRIIAQGRVTGHNRASEWYKLVGKVVEQEERRGELGTPGD